MSTAFGGLSTGGGEPRTRRLDEPSPIRVAHWDRLARGLGAAVAVWGFLVLFLWGLGLGEWTGFLPALPTMHPWVALLTLLLGACTATFPHPGARATAFWPVVVITTATALASAFLSFDGEQVFARTEQVPAITALCLAGLGVALGLLHRDRVVPADVVAIVTGLSGLLAASSFLFAVHFTDERLGTFRDVALSTALCLVALATAILGLRADHGLLRLVTEDNAGADLLRRFLPAAALAQLVVVGGSYVLHDLELLGVRTAFALCSTGGIAAVTWLVWAQATELRSVDVQRAGEQATTLQLQATLAERDALSRRVAINERTLRQVIENSSDGYVAIDDQAVVTQWNGQCAAIFGWSAEEAVGAELFSLVVPPEARELHRRVVRGWDRDGQVETPLEVVGVRRDGTEISVEVRVWSVHDGRRRTFHAFVRDITERRLAQAELLRANRDLEEFAAVAAHDLRSPLVAIRFTAELLKERHQDVSAEQVADWARRIVDAATRGSELIADLLRLASLSRTAPTFTLVDLTALAERAADLARTGADPMPSITVGPLPTIVGDPGLLTQLFANLIDNAVRHTPEGQAAEVRVETVSRRPGRVELSVTDSGPGIPEDELSRIFDMFTRGTRADDDGGVGLGLAICRRVAEHHGGSIVAENVPEGGARFTVTLAPGLAP